jgi:septal ring factor EnvC (AmiA/AmiB activator)
MFESFVASMTEHELRQVRETFARLRKSLTDLKTTTEPTAETLEEIRIEHDAVPDAVNAALATNESRRKAVVLP